MTRYFDTASDAPRLPPARSVRGIMATVLVALVPGVALHVLAFGPGLLLQIALAVTFALVLEAAMLRLRQRPLRPFLTDLSAPLTATLFAICLPPLAPWWIALVGMIAAIVVAKHLYGGLGFNPFNPAMVGYAVVLIAFPLELTRWTSHGGIPAGSPDVFLTLRHVFLPGAADHAWDSIAQATPLDVRRTLTAQGWSLGEIARSVDFARSGAGQWQALAWAWLAGGLFLLWRRVVPWQVPVAMLATTLLLSLLPWLWDADRHPAPLDVMLSGGIMFAAWFIATDPVSGCTTPRGRLLFGIGVAALALAIRSFGAYPEGVAFAVLLMNCAAPWIDRHTRPRIYGESRAP